MKAHLEHMTTSERQDQNSQFGGCDFEETYVDYDGSWAAASCAAPAEVWFCFPDWQDDMAIAMCRPHGNLCLIAERSGI